jgi:hypothetical protein
VPSLVGLVWKVVPWAEHPMVECSVVAVAVGLVVVVHDPRLQIRSVPSMVAPLVEVWHQMVHEAIYHDPC